MSQEPSYRHMWGIEIVPYDPSWGARFEAEAARVREALGDLALRIDHIGSTAVPGLGAKPIVDITLAVLSLRPVERYQGSLEALGYVFRPDDEPQHEFFYMTDERGRRVVHIHVCEAGGDFERRHLAFRDELRRDPTLAAEYERLKRDLAARHPQDIDAYVEGKSPFIGPIDERTLRGA